MSDLTEQLTDQLALVERQLSEHQTAIWLLEQRRLTLRTQLKAAGFVPPEPAQKVLV